MQRFASEFRLLGWLLYWSMVIRVLSQYWKVSPWKTRALTKYQILTIRGSILAYVSLTCCIWITAPTFGSQPECGGTTVYVIFGISINATSPVFRYIIQTTIAFLALILILDVLMPSSIFCYIRRLSRGLPRHKVEHMQHEGHATRVSRKIIATIVSVGFYI